MSRIELTFLIHSDRNNVKDLKAYSAAQSGKQDFAQKINQVNHLK